MDAYFAKVPLSFENPQITVLVENLRRKVISKTTGKKRGKSVHWDVNQASKL